MITSVKAVGPFIAPKSTQFRHKFSNFFANKNVEKIYVKSFKHFY